MKRFLLRALLFMSVPTVLAVAWTAFVVGMDYLSYTRALRLPAGTTAVVCGDSQTKDALDPARIEGLANFSTAATTPDQDLMRLLDLLVANKGRIRHVFLDVSPLKVGYMEEACATPPRPPKPVSELGATRVHALLHFYHLTENRRPLGSLGALWRDVVCVRKYNEFRKAILRGRKWRSSMAGAFDPDPVRGFAEPKLRAKAMADVLEKADRVNSRPPATVGIPLVAALVESAGMVRAAGAEPVFTTMPLSLPLRGKIDPAKLAAFTEAVRDAAVRLDVPYLDYLRLDLPEELWHDGNHLNRSGAEAFSTRFAADFAALRKCASGRNRHSAPVVEYVGEVGRPAQPDDLSGLSWAGGDVYWSARDSGGVLCELRIPLDRATGAVRGCEVLRSLKVPTGCDLEGTVYDPLRKTVWLSDEKGPSIFEFDPAKGLTGVRVELPADLFCIQKNRGLEALEISSDGLDLWTCNENVLRTDVAALPGPCEFVRLTRFTRSGADGAWRVSGQWAYRPETAGGIRIRRKARNGVSSVLSLDDGTLLVLEREKAGGGMAGYRIRIYVADYSQATDVRGWMSLGDSGFVPVRKRLVFERETGAAMYEGMGLGPELEDGSRSLLLVSDGDGAADEKILALRLRTGAAQPASSR